MKLLVIWDSQPDVCLPSRTLCDLSAGASVISTQTHRFSHFLLTSAAITELLVLVTAALASRESRNRTCWISCSQRHEVKDDALSSETLADDPA